MEFKITVSTPYSSSSPNDDEKGKELLSEFFVRGQKFEVKLSQVISILKCSSLPSGQEWSSNDEWNDPTVVELENLLSIDLGFAFQGAIRKIVESGHNNEEAVRAVCTIQDYKKIRLNDVETNIVESVTEALKTKSKSTRFADLDSAARSVAHMLVTEARRMVPHLSLAEAIWCLLICDSNVNLVKLADYLLKKSNEGRDVDLYLLPRQYALDQEVHDWTKWGTMKVDQVVKRLQEEDQELKKLKADKNHKEEEPAKKMAELTSNLHASKSAIQVAESESAKLEKENSKLRKSMEDEKKKIDDICEKIKQSKIKKEDYVKRLQEAKIEKSIDSLANELMEIKAKRQEIESQVNEQKADLVKLQTLLAEISPLITQIAKIKAEIAALKASKNKIRLPALRDIYDENAYKCILCMTHERTVLFLPCAHQVVCVNCNEDPGMTECPACWTVITARVSSVFSDTTS